MRLISECGLYEAELIESDGLHYRLFDRSGAFLFETTYWSNLYTETRIRFEVGSGPVTAVFSYPRYPRWFRRRWVLCFDMWVDELKALVESFGCEVLECFKPDWNCWSHIGFRADVTQVRQVDEELTRRKVQWNGPPYKPGQWDISCPRAARFGATATKGAEP